MTGDKLHEKLKQVRADMASAHAVRMHRAVSW